jgi:hypothetical protein
MKGLVHSLEHTTDTSSLLTTVVIKDLPVTVVKGLTSFGSAAIRPVPRGNVFYHGAIGQLQVSTTSGDVVATFSGDLSVGTVAATGVPFTGSNLSTLDTTPIGPAVAKVTPVHRAIGLRSNSSRITDNTDGQDIIYLNLSIDDADISATSTFLVNGTVKIMYGLIGVTS